MPTEPTAKQSRSDVKTTSPSNPLAIFELNVHMAWLSPAEPEAKAQKLYELSEQIARYTRRIDSELLSLARDGDEWTKLALQRARGCLLQLAADTRKLAVKAQQQTANVSSSISLA